MTPEIQLPKVVQTKINRLALAAGRSPADLMRFVLRDGLVSVEASIKENAIADKQFANGLYVSNAQVRRDALKALGQAAAGR